MCLSLAQASAWNEARGRQQEADVAPPKAPTSVTCAGLARLMQLTASKSADTVAQARTQEPLLSISPHVSHCMSREDQMQIMDEKHPTTAASTHSPGGAISASGKQTLQQQQQQQQQSPRRQSRAHRQLFAQQSPTDGHQEQHADGAEGVPNSTAHHQQQPQQQQGQSQHQQPTQQQQLAPAGHEIGEDADQIRRKRLLLYSRQRLFLCKLCRNPGRGLLCEPPSMQKIEYYQSSSDVPLASFVAASAPHKCLHPACGDGVASHLRTYLHNKGRITLSISQTAAGKELPGADKGQVWFWARPLQVGFFSGQSEWQFTMFSGLTAARVFVLKWDAQDTACDGCISHGPQMLLIALATEYMVTCP